MYMQDIDRMFTFTLLPAPKCERIREELKLHNRLRITYDQYKKAMSATLSALSGIKGEEPLQSYIRPTRPRR